MEKLMGALQENIIVLLCYDEKAIPFIISNIKVEHMESVVYRDIVSLAIDYWRRYKSPIAEHLPDLLEHVITGKNTEKGRLYADVINDIYIAKDTVKREYVLDEISKYVRHQNLKLSIKEAVLEMQKGDLDKAEVVLNSYRKKKAEVFDPGISFLDEDRTKLLGFRNTIDNFIRTGIPELDRYGIAPAPKKLFVIVGLPNYGKSWSLIHLGRRALMERKKVLHVTLELSQEEVTMRYLQTLFGIAPYEVDLQVPRFSHNGLNELVDIDVIRTNIRPRHLHQDDIDAYLVSRLDSFRRLPLIVKEYPTGMLTMDMLKEHIDCLEEFYNFSPDVVIIDYVDLMTLNANSLRLDTGRMYKELRGLAIERYLAAITVSQANRAAEDQRWITRKHFAEDISKVHIADHVVIFNQTQMEMLLGIGRLFVDKTRGWGGRGSQILIKQNLKTGQFYMGSTEINSKYWALLDRLKSGNHEDK